MRKFRGYPVDYLWNEMDELMATVEERLANVLSERCAPALTGRVGAGFRPDFRVDVVENDGETLVIADLPGAKRDECSLHLLDPTTVEITCERSEQDEKEDEGYYVRERCYGTLKRTIKLPSPVTEEGAKARFKNGVLEVRLKKIQEETGSRIPIE